MSAGVSIILCTRDRAGDLLATLASFEGLELPPDWTVELIVVDNASADDTASVARTARLPQLAVRYVHEPRAGKGHAYNRGVAEATGDVLLFTDDDVRPPADWVERMCRPILAGACDAVAGGVRFAPHLERPWLEPHHRSWLAATDYIDRVNPERLVGANMAIGRRVFDRIGGFDPELGPGALGFADETLLSRQIAEAGFKIGAAFDVEVEHHFDPSRLTRKGFLAAASKFGRSDCYMVYHWDHYENPRPYRTVVRQWLRLGYFYVTRWPDLLRVGHIPAWEMNAWKDVYFHFHYLRERRRCRNYDRRGMTRRVVSDVGPTIHASVEAPGVTG